MQYQLASRKVSNSNIRQAPRQPEFRPQLSKRASQVTGKVEKVCKSNSSSVAKEAEPLPHKYKTEMCRMYAKGLPCSFGKKCNYAHGEAELAKFTKMTQREPSTEPQLKDAILPLHQKAKSIGHSLVSDALKQDKKLDWTSMLGKKSKTEFDVDLKAGKIDFSEQHEFPTIESPRSNESATKSDNSVASLSTDASEPEHDIFDSPPRLTLQKLDAKQASFGEASLSLKKSDVASSRPMYQSLLQSLEVNGQQLLASKSGSENQEAAWIDTWWESVQEEDFKSLSPLSLQASNDAESGDQAYLERQPAKFSRLSCFKLIAIDEDSEEECSEEQHESQSLTSSDGLESHQSESSDEQPAEPESSQEALQSNFEKLTLARDDSSQNLQMRSQRGSRKYRPRRLYRVETSAVPVAAF